MYSSTFAKLPITIILSETGIIAIDLAYESHKKNSVYNFVYTYVNRKLFIEVFEPDHSCSKASIGIKLMVHYIICFSINKCRFSISQNPHSEQNRNDLFSLQIVVHACAKKSQLILTGDYLNIILVIFTTCVMFDQDTMS